MSYLDNAGLEKLWLGIKAKLASKSDTGHKHTKADVTDFSHTHTKADITDFSHTHTKSQITDFPTIPSVTVSSGDSGKSYTIKVSTSAPASGTSNNVITFVTE